MAGNPFRTSLVVQNNPAAAPPTSFPPADSHSRREERHVERDDDSVLEASPAPAKTKKTVRIEETILPHPDFGHVDNETTYAPAPGRRAGSPPPDFADELEERYPQDPAGRDVDARGMLGSAWKSTASPQPVTSPSGAPANPFARTLATIEPQEKGGDAAGQPKERTAIDKTAPGPKRQSLNVEGFKNLLMQGITPSPRNSAPPPIAPAPSSNSLSPAVFESSSSTDTSSISRQSIFDTAQEPHPESPRTSYDMAASEDEHAGLMRGETPKREKKKPPPAPRHRHGKLVKERTPQTVPFDEFSVAEVTLELKPHKRTNSDLNKPLPPTPPIPTSAPAHIISQDASYDTASLSETRDSETASMSETAPARPQKKVPPPVPLARRQSQLRSSTTSNRSRSNSSLTMSSQHSTDLPPIASAQEPRPYPSATPKAPPPPPPSRRHGNALPTINTSSANSSSTELSTSARPAVASPNPPSSRRTTFASEPPSPSAGPTRTPSMHSARTTSRAVSSESTSTNTNLPPPPPPPRRRQSGRASLDLQRPSLPPGPSLPGPRHTSMEYKRHSRSSMDGKRQGSIASVNSLSREYAPDEMALYSPREEVEDPAGEGRGLGGEGLSVVDAGEKDEDREKQKEKEKGSNASNILDDMERFQREIDELRERYQKAA
ncbi:hypothetical protein P171DRAFT_21924 [Karstenula rhodostoma CBS 690.94]|uniref:Uncharacterized protein n=1 Tax=Karstenula rhodostoma CBS 690.94 TaxID=1392251 RepID=A0A9P4PJB9_9PLEO|nr:hypothetical protein P171DRAFT_21924 [Karstenula rhodostoma CBS 690.94]